MSGIRQRGIPLVAAVAVLVVGVSGSATGAGRAHQQATKATATNLQLLAGPDPDYALLGEARGLSATPVFMVTGAPLELDVSRSAGVVSVRQGGSLLAVRPRSVLLGIPRYFQWKLLRADGRVVASAQVDACPMPGNVFTRNGWGYNTPFNLDPANPRTPARFRYPSECGDPLTTRAHWGFPSGWGAQVHIKVPNSTPVGRYILDATVNPDGAIHESTRADNHVRMPVDVLDLTSGALAKRAAAEQQNGGRVVGAPDAAGSDATGRATAGQSTAPAAAGSASVTSADAAAVDLPDLVPLPSENIAARHEGDADLLRFNSTMTNLGRGTLQVDGFRSGAQAKQMTAYQVLYRHGTAVARRPAGTLVYDSDPEHNHWHFDSLARYQLVDARNAVVANSGKIGFCMGDVHQIDAGKPNFLLPDIEGFDDCGTSLSRSVQERLDVGWGDEYDQIKPGQELDITTVPNGTYRIRILADPERKLREATRDNNVSDRTVILGGRKGARTVQVPPIDGVDTEAAWAADDLPF